MAGDRKQAREHYHRALPIALDTQAIPVVLDALSGIGQLFAQEGKLEDALMLSCFILNHPSCEIGTRSRTQELRLSLETGLSPKQFEAACLTGQEMTLDSIVSEVLGTA